MSGMMKVYQEINKRRQSDEMDVNSLTMFAEAWEFQQGEIDNLQTKIAELRKKYDNLNNRATGIVLSQMDTAKLNYELQCRIDEVLKACNKLRTDSIREHRAEYDKGWKDCATSIYHQLKRV